MFNWKGDKVTMCWIKQNGMPVHIHCTLTWGNYFIYHNKIAENSEPHNIRHCLIPIIAEISIHLSKVLLCALINFYTVCTAPSHKYVYVSMYLPKKTAKIPFYYNMPTFLIEEGEKWCSTARKILMGCSPYQ